MGHDDSTISESTDGGWLDMAVWPTEAEGREATFAVTFLNQANAPAAVALEARAGDDGLRFHIEPQSLVIVPAATMAPLMVHVGPNKRPVSGQPHPYEIELRGLPMGDKETSTAYLVQRVRFTYVPRYVIPWPAARLRRLITAAVVAAAVLLAAVMAAVHATGWLSVMAVAVLLILLVEKQRMAGASGGRAKELSRALTIAILPLLLAIAFNVLVEVVASVSQGQIPAATPIPASRAVRSALSSDGSQERRVHRPHRTLTHRAAAAARPAVASGAVPPLPEVLLNPAAVRFGRRRVGGTGPARVIHVVNLGPAPVALAGVAIGGPARGDFAARDTCAGAPIGAYGGCTVSVRFSPRAGGPRRARLILTARAARGSWTVPLSGQG